MKKKRIKNWFDMLRLVHIGVPNIFADDPEWKENNYLNSVNERN